MQYAGWLTGFVSAFIVLAITFLIPKIGARQLVVVSIAGQILMAMLVSHFGMLESPQDPITLKKLPVRRCWSPVSRYR